MGIRRRQFLASGAVGGLALAAGNARAQGTETPRWSDSYSGAGQKTLAPGMPGEHYRPVHTPNGSSLPFRVVDGVKVFHLVAEEVEHQFAPGLEARCWGYNGQVHGPTIEAVEGDRIRVYVTNRLPAATTVHWHGAFLPSGMDGVGGLSQRAIQPGETFVYEWTLRQHGTLMYHSHHDEMTQMAMGLMGMLVIHPRETTPDDVVDHDFALMLSEWSLQPGARRPDPNAMSDFNILTINARCYPGTEDLQVRTGDRVRLRFGNLSAMDHHPIHLHGHWFHLTGTEGGAVPLAARYPESTVLVPTGATRTIEFIADNPGDWAVHCHMTHHVMNQMGHELRNLVGADPARLQAAVSNWSRKPMIMGTDGMGEHGRHIEAGHMAVPDNALPMVGAEGPWDYITMGGMFTLLKVRDAGEEGQTWHQPKAGSMAQAASAEALRRDGIKT